MPASSPRSSAATPDPLSSLIPNDFHFIDLLRRDREVHDFLTARGNEVAFHAVDPAGNTCSSFSIQPLLAVAQRAQQERLTGVIKKTTKKSKIKTDLPPQRERAGDEMV